MASGTAMSTRTLETIEVEIEGPIAWIRLNRPDRLNAYTTQMGIEIFGTLADLDESDDTRAIIITGNGRGFCAGADLESGGSTFDGPDFERAAVFEKKVAPWRMRTPVICAFNGPAVGIGATLPLHWDMRIASDKAKIGFVFTRRGIIPEANSTWILPRMIGLSKASDLLITGKILTAQEALDYGIVSRVVPHDDLIATARGMAMDIATNTAPVSVAITKRLLWRQLLADDPQAAKDFESELFYWVGKQPDAAEGVNSFLEKRDPRWSMSLQDLPESLD